MNRGASYRVVGDAAVPQSRRLFPRVLEIGPGKLDSVGAILQRAGLPLDRVLLVSGGGRTRPFSQRVSAGLTALGAEVHPRLEPFATRAAGERLAAEAAELTVDLIIAVGGGRVIDVAKTAALAWEVDVVTVPTSVAHDGISSPVASLTDDLGIRASLPAAMPAAVIVDIDVVQSAPFSTLRAGVGDLVSNLSAVEDWRLADARGRDAYDAYPALMADGAARLALRLDGALRPGAVELLARGLILSGLAMLAAGTSRPCSGAEHLISHSLDQLLGDGARLHGEQVALGTLIATAARGQSPAEYRATFRRCGLATHPAELGLSMDLMVEAVMKAPATRPNRYTILDEIDLRRPAVTDLLVEAFSS